MAAETTIARTRSTNPQNAVSGRQRMKSLNEIREQYNRLSEQNRSQRTAPERGMLGFQPRIESALQSVMNNYMANSSRAGVYGDNTRRFRTNG